MPRYISNVHDETLHVGGNDDDQTISIHRSQILDRLEVMKKQERTTYRIRDYLKDYSTEKLGAIDAACRYKMVRWCFTIVDHANLDRQTVCIAMSYLDRFLSGSSSRARRVAEDRNQFQLASMTALYMAIKVFEPRVLDATQLAELSVGKFEAADVIRMESDMLLDLNWHMNGPTAVSFLVYFVALLRAHEHSKKGDVVTINYDSVLADARYQIELSVTQYRYVTQHPSTIAVAALVNSIQNVTTPMNSRRIIDQLAEITGRTIDIQSSSHLSKITQCMNKMQCKMINSKSCFRKRPSHAVWTVVESSLLHEDRKLAAGRTQSSINRERSSPISLCV